MIKFFFQDSGLKELKKNDVAMIFYITVTVTGQKTIRLSSSSTKCCRKVREGDQDCESIRLHGGDIGFLKPSDNRNLTLIYSNLYLHDLVGSCTIDIKDEGGNVQKHEIKFDTSLAKKGTTYIPRFMEQYYKLEDVTYCKEADENPLDNCMTYECDIRYDGFRNYYDFKGKRCTKLPKCLPTANEGDPNAIVSSN
ncbi:uncharacterized protein TNCT_402011 [Trichonephila clavata]|uniref:Uncharacterized protein n=1 Tax=Trichonephila clavata TaxID=2740835 RepID=A0A8X6JGU2_TRICU|nr:uncharacterized protein TNCT_402011 [Trichonephila clavata]